MRSPVRRVRLERGLRLASFVLLAFCAYAMLTAGRGDRGTAGPERQFASRLGEWTRRSPGDTLALTLSSAPAPVERDWLRAIARSGTAVTWSGAVPATAIEVLPLADPAGGFTALTAAPAGTWVELADSLGTIDSARSGRAGAAFGAAAHTGALRMLASGQTAATPGRDSLGVRHAVILARAGWEARFVIAALEERGWLVDARLAVAPGIAVTQGRPLPLDTARHAVVVALDSLVGADAAAIQRFVTSGGGAVLAPFAAATLRAIAAGRVGAHVRPASLSFASASPAAALAMDPVVPVSDAVVLERHGAHVVLAARRHGAGRVVQTGYDETWRWRMGGRDGAAEAHREWWAGVVASAAYQPGVGDRVSGVGNESAPLASLVAALGAASPPAAASARLPDLRTLLPTAALLLFLCLLFEWSSRRLRGAA